MKIKYALKDPISITAISSISPLGFSAEAIWKNYKSSNHFISKKTIGNSNTLVAEIDLESQSLIDVIRHENAKYKLLDNSVLFGIFAAREAIKQVQWQPSDNFGINIGSSRGATQLFEHYHSKFLKSNTAETLSSPTTTLGNISSWIAHDLQTQGPEISHSITCSTALHALINGIAWLHSGLTDKFLVGGSEAPLTPFTIAQMKALKIYANDNIEFPCQAIHKNKTKNTMVLGEGAAVACLEKGEFQNALAKIKGFGYATEILEHNASLSTNALCFQRSMTMALGKLRPEDIDVIVTHTPGTIKGDRAELNAIEKIFCNKMPSLTTNKWKVGHSLGASGMMSIEMAILMLQNQTFISVPYIETKHPRKIEYILINAVGFGGNAVSILLSK